MVNPWISLPASALFVLSRDAEAIEAFNAGASESHAIHLEVIPEPFIGLPDAPVVLLNLNPGLPMKISLRTRSRRSRHLLRTMIAKRLMWTICALLRSDSISRRCGSGVL